MVFFCSGKAPSAHPAEKSSEDGGGAGDKANENGDKEDREDGEMVRENWNPLKTL